MWRSLLVLLMLGACDGGSRPPATVDAPPSIDAPPFSCTPARTQPAEACLALAPSTLQGVTPFGNLDLALDNFGAGDCITISSANVTWRGACGEELRLTFSYPVTSTGATRSVTTSFERMARFDFSAPGITQHHDVLIRVEVARWEEGQGTHDIDITVTVMNPLYTLPPIRVEGTFCDWPLHLC